MNKRKTAFFVFKVYFLILPAFYYIGDFGFPRGSNTLPFIFIGILLLTSTSKLISHSSHKLLIPLLGLFLFASFTILWALEKRSAYYQIYQTGIDLTSLFVSISIIRKYYLPINVLFWHYIAGVILINAYALFYFDAHVLFSTIDGRYIGIEGTNPTSLSAHAVWAFIAGLHIYSIKKRVLLQPVSFFLLALIFLLIILQTRTAILSLLLAIPISFIIIYYASRGQTINKKKLKSIVIISILLFIVYVVSKPLLLDIEYAQGFNRIESLFSRQSGVGLMDVTGRNEIWKSYMYSLDQSSIIGSGMRSAVAWSNSTSGIGINPHNAFILTFIEFGLIGFSLFVLFYLKSAIYLAKHHPFSHIAIIMIISLLVFSFSNDVVHHRYWWAGLNVFFLLILNIEKESSKVINHNNSKIINYFAK